MAQRRMFSMRIVGSDQFLDMPISSQALYFHLGMYADDDGFVSPQKVIRMIGANSDDLKVLTTKKFIIPFENGVIVITNWKENNYIQSDRYQSTIFIKEKEKLQCIQNVYSMYTQVRLGKVRLELGKDKDIVAEASSAEKEFSFKGEIQKMEESPRRDINIIAMYFEERKPDIQNKEQLSVAIRRHLRAAKDLSPFTDNQILDALPKAKKSTPDFTLETIIKMLTK